MINLLTHINWGNVPQWLSWVSTIFIAFGINNYSNKLKKYELQKQYEKSFYDEIENILKSLHLLKRSIELDIEEDNISDNSIDNYLSSIRDIRKSLPIWLIEVEGTFLLIEDHLRMLKKLKLKDRTKFATNIIAIILGSIVGLKENISTYLSSYNDFRS
jgi:hypothetical protein